MKLGSLFDGIGGFPLSATRHGIEPVWASEIEPFPIRVTKERFPDMVHLGDITKINGAEIEPVDIITFGSPCQDLSVAGKRAGMQHESKGDEQTTRSGLFMEAVRIIKEMRSATGIRDTNDGCAELDAGKAAGDTSGKPRNGVCGNSGGEDATTRDGATGHVRPRFAVWENVPGAYSSNKGEDFRVVLEELARVCAPSASIPRPARKWLNDGAIVGDGFSIAWRTLDAQHWGVPQRRRRIYLVADFAGGRAPEVLFESRSDNRHIAESGEAGEGVAADAQGSVDGSVTVALYENHGQDSRLTGPLDISPTVAAKFGTGGNNTPLVEHYRKSRRAQSVDDCETWVPDEVANTVNCFDVGDVRSTDIVMAHGQANAEIVKDGCPALTCNHEQPILFPSNRMRVRRLTPLECERLQGFHDGWTDIPGGSDSARYKALGNSLAIPCAEFVIEGIAEATTAQ